MSISPTLEFLALVAFDDYCGTWWPRRGGPGGPPPGPGNPWFKAATNIYYSIVGVALITAVVTHPEQAMDLRYGPFVLIPAFRVLSGLYFNNISVEEEMKHKRE